MPELISLLRVFVSSPGDLTAERGVVEEVLSELNLSLPQSQKIRFELVKWETHAFPSMETDPQALINAQIGDDYDIFLGLMWARFGTPTNRAGSGTEEEFNRAYNRYTQNPNSLRILFYFKTAPTTGADPGQLELVNEFRDRLKKKGLYWSFENPKELARYLRIHLRRHLDEFGKGWGLEEREDKSVNERAHDPVSGITVTASKKAFARIKNDVPDARNSFVVSYPRIDGINSQEVLNRINSVLSFERVFDVSVKEEIEDSYGLSDLDFSVDFLKTPFLVVTLTMEGVGAYPWSHAETLVIDVMTGQQLSAADLFEETLLAQLAARINALFLLDKKRAELTLAHESGDEDLDTKGRHLDFAPESFTVRDLDHFSLDDDGVTFKFSFQYPHVIKALEPDGEYTFSYSSLKRFIKKGGVLDRFLNSQPK
jgi:hypothetical protein